MTELGTAIGIRDGERYRIRVRAREEVYFRAVISVSAVAEVPEDHIPDRPKVRDRCIDVENVLIILTARHPPEFNCRERVYRDRGRAEELVRRRSADGGR
ncbi:MAG: hypothetical protein MZV63_60280 [Marinilabiliales bacterium]|nr:hypothetical protein [Marinilabiliales bacterium]